MDESCNRNIREVITDGVAELCGCCMTPQWGAWGDGHKGSRVVSRRLAGGSGGSRRGSKNRGGRATR
ncbi:hypothetical protein DP49_5184 [Burkholderia pseudomallei]|nr:hypothetical protein DP49_5184 [Burkholderia pseudomallei]